MKNTGIHPEHLVDYVVAPALQFLGMDSPAARALLMGTAAQESLCGRFLRQVGGGCAMGVFQMEPETYGDIWKNYLEYRPELRERILARFPRASAELMMSDLIFAAVMCRLHYRRVKEKLPAADNVGALAEYYVQHYNTPLGKATVAEFISNFQMVA
jgi:hypothetical protein